MWNDSSLNTISCIPRITLSVTFRSTVTNKQWFYGIIESSFLSRFNYNYILHFIIIYLDQKVLRLKDFKSITELTNISVQQNLFLSETLLGIQPPRNFLFHPFDTDEDCQNSYHNSNLITYRDGMALHSLFVLPSWIRQLNTFTYLKILFSASRSSSYSSTCIFVTAKIYILPK
jgi:hypothetical protein